MDRAGGTSPNGYLAPVAGDAGVPSLPCSAGYRKASATYRRDPRYVSLAPYGGGGGGNLEYTQVFAGCNIEPVVVTQLI